MHSTKRTLPKENNVYFKLWVIIIGVLWLFAWLVATHSLTFVASANVKSKIYIVQDGDTLWSIASKYSHGDPRNLVEEISEENHLGPSDRILIGQVLHIPQK